MQRDGTMSTCLCVVVHKSFTGLVKFPYGWHGAAVGVIFMIMNEVIMSLVSVN